MWRGRSSFASVKCSPSASSIRPRGRRRARLARARGHSPSRSRSIRSSVHSGPFGHRKRLRNSLWGGRSDRGRWSLTVVQLSLSEYPRARRVRPRIALASMASPVGVSGLRHPCSLSKGTASVLSSTSGCPRNMGGSPKPNSQGPKPPWNPKSAPRPGTYS